MKIKQLAKKIENSRSVVFFTGAGVSTESGIPDFRSASGVYSDNDYGYPPEAIISRDFFFDNTRLFYKFYFEKIVHMKAMPNDFHYGITKFRDMGYDVTVVTQNIDNLHTMAGNHTVHELHGNINRNYCINCNTFYDLKYMYENRNEIVKCEKCDKMVKPDVVLYNEQLDDIVINKAVKAIKDSDVLIIAGTSLSVYPAASFVKFYEKDCMCLMNKTETAYDSYADYVFYDSCSVTLNKVIKTIESNN